MYWCMVSRIALLERRISPSIFLPVYVKNLLKWGQCAICSASWLLLYSAMFRWLWNLDGSQLNCCNLIRSVVRPYKDLWVPPDLVPMDREYRWTHFGVVRLAWGGDGSPLGLNHPKNTQRPEWILISKSSFIYLTYSLFGYCIIILNESNVH